MISQAELARALLRKAGEDRYVAERPAFRCPASRVAAVARGAPALFLLSWERSTRHPVQGQPFADEE